MLPKCPRLNTRPIRLESGRGKTHDMSTEVEIERVLATVTATLNDHKLEHFEASRVQEIIAAALGGEQRFRVDGGGGLHDEAGARIGAIRRTDSGEWITERQSPAAARSDTAIPGPPPRGKLRKLLTKLRVGGA